MGLCERLGHLFDVLVMVRWLAPVLNGNRAAGRAPLEAIEDANRLATKRAEAILNI